MDPTPACVSRRVPEPSGFISHKLPSLAVNAIEPRTLAVGSSAPRAVAVDGPEDPPERGRLPPDSLSEVGTHEQHTARTAEAMITQTRRIVRWASEPTGLTVLAPIAPLSTTVATRAAFQRFRDGRWYECA